MITAIALSGGGAKGSFQLGALRYLFERVLGKGDPLPTVLSGTSVGSVNATKLAEGDGMASFLALEKIWFNLRVNEDMYLKQPWFKTLDPILQDAINIAAGGEFDIFELAWDYLINDEIFGVPVAEVEKAFDQMKVAKSIYNLNPINNLMLGGALNEPKLKKSKNKLRLAVVSLETAELRYVTEGGTLITRDGKAVEWAVAPTVQQLPAPCKAAHQKLQDLKADKAALQNDLKKAVSAQDRSFLMREIHRLTRSIGQVEAELNACVNKNGGVKNVPKASVVSIREGVLASSAIPAVFEPTKLLDETYVDGGVREIVPIQAAIDAGAEKIYAIACAREGLEKTKIPGNIPEVAKRALETALDEIDLNETTKTELWKGKEVILIRPNYEVHDALTISYGLIRIAAAYGYMRAADRLETAKAVDEVYRAASAVSDQIARLRTKNYGAEERYLFKRVMGVHTEGLLAQSRQNKREIRKLVIEQRLPKWSLPPGIEKAWLDWERIELAKYEPKVWTPTKPAFPKACEKLNGELLAARQKVEELEGEREGLDKHDPRRLALSKLLGPAITKAQAAEKKFRDCVEANTTPPPPPIPTACNAQKTELENLKSELADLQDELKGGDKEDGPGRSKSSIMQDIKKKNAEITVADRDLDLCVARNTPVHPPDPMFYGLLLKSKSSPSKKYVLYGGSKLLLRSSKGQDFIKEMGYKDEFIEVDDTILGRFPDDSPIDGTLLKTRVSPYPFVMENGKRRAVPPAVFTKYKFSTMEIRYVPEETLNAIPKGSDLT